jgi:hypothetical protein
VTDFFPDETLFSFFSPNISVCSDLSIGDAIEGFLVGVCFLFVLFVFFFFFFFFLFFSCTVHRFGKVVAGKLSSQTMDQG